MWHHSLKDWELAPLELYKFVLTESDKAVTDVLSNAEAITNRAYIILGFLVTGISVSAGYVIRMQEANSDMNFMQFCALLFLLPLFRCLVFILQIIRGRVSYRNGTEPKELMTSQYFEAANLDDEKSEKEKLLHRYVIEQNQEKITRTVSSNVKRIALFEDAVLYLLFTLLLFIACVGINAFFIS